MKYIFLHIPKNGGTTLQYILDDQYRRSQIYDVPDNKRDTRLRQLRDKSNLSKSFIKVVKGGHFSYGCHEYFKNPSRVKYFAMLRDPIVRAVSYYSYVKRTPEHYLNKSFLSEHITFDDFLVRKDLNMEICNGQTKLIAGLDQQDECTGEVFKMAKKHLDDSFFLVGIVEKYIETLFMLKTMLGWTKPITYKALNVNSDRNFEITLTQREVLTELNQFDIALYTYVMEIFEKRFGSFSETDFNTFKNNLQL